MPGFPIVDSHVHLYDPAVLRIGWIAGNPVLEGPHLPADLDAARGSVEVAAMVFVEVGADPGQHLEEVRFVTELAAREPRIRAIVAAAPLERGAAIEPDLEQLAANPLVKGVRRLIQDEPDPEFCLQPRFVEGVRRLASFGLSFDLCVYHHQLSGALELVRRCPEIRFVLDHIGKPGIKAGLLEPWRGQIRALAALPNVVCKLSGVITEADHAAWTCDQLEPYIRHVVDCFGFERVLFGSDWPVSEQTHRYGKWVAIVDGALAGATPSERRRVFRDNAIAVYRLSREG
jgi:L-fuconolactonase